MKKFSFVLLKLFLATTLIILTFQLIVFLNSVRNDEFYFSLIKSNDYQLYNEFKKDNVIYKYSGTAFAFRYINLKKNDLFLISNAHVCRDNKVMNVKGWLNKEIKVLKVDEKKDLCLLEAPEQNLTAYIFINTEFYYGQKVYTGGHSLGKKFRFNSSFLLDYNEDGLIDTTLKVLPGASGSPVIDLFGRVVGVINSYDPNDFEGMMVSATDLKIFIEEYENSNI